MLMTKAKYVSRKPGPQSLTARPENGKKAHLEQTAVSNVVVLDSAIFDEKFTGATF